MRRFAGVCFALVACLLFTESLFIFDPQNDAGEVLACLGLWSLTLVFIWCSGYVFKEDYEYRQARKDSRNTGSSSSTGYPASTTLGAGTSAAITGAQPARVYARAHSMGAIGTTREGASIVQQEEPIRAWKVAHARLNPDGHIEFRAVTSDMEYGVVAAAKCRRMVDHMRYRDPVIPAVGCTCGFYALQTREAAEAYSRAYSRSSNMGMSSEGFFPAILEVDLYGKVIVGSNGYRAEKIRVLAVEASYGPKCQWTGAVTRQGLTHPMVCDKVATYIERNPRCGEVVVAGKYVCNEHKTLHIPISKLEMQDATNAETEWKWV